MSEHWTIYCESCEEYGPDLVRAARGFYISNYWPRFHPDHGADGKTGTPDESWSAFMERHGSCEPRLVHE